MMKTGNFGINAYGLQIGIQLSSLAYREQILDHLPPGWVPDSTRKLDRVYTLYAAEASESGQHELQVDGDLLYFHRNLADVMRWFEADVRIFVAQQRRDLLFVHAGAVSWRGKAIILPGRESTGKTTLVRALLDAGATYYSDTFAVFDRQGRVHPYSRPLGNGTYGELDQACGSDLLPASLVVATTYKRGAVWQPKRLSADCAMLVLFANAVATHPLPGSALTTLRKVVSDAVILEGPRGEADEMAELILNELSAPGIKDRAAAQIASSSSSSSCF